MLTCYFVLASGHSLWGLVFKRTARAEDEPAGPLQYLQLLLFEIELPVRTSPRASLHRLYLLTVPCLWRTLARAAGLGADRRDGVGLPAPCAARRQPLPNFLRPNLRTRYVLYGHSWEGGNFDTNSGAIDRRTASPTRRPAARGTRETTHAVHVCRVLAGPSAGHSDTGTCLPACLSICPSATGLNAAVMLGEYALSKMAIRPSHVYFVALWPSLYVLYQLFLLYPLSPNGHWAYPFMKTDTIMVLPWMLGLLLLHAIFFAGCLGIGRVPTPFQARAARLNKIDSLGMVQFAQQSSFSCVVLSSHVRVFGCRKLVWLPTFIVGVGWLQVAGRRPAAAAPSGSTGMNATLITASQRQRRSADGMNQWLVGSHDDVQPTEALV